MRRGPAFAVIVTVLAVLWAGSADASKNVYEKRKLDADGSLYVENISGSVEVRGWDKDEVEVSGVLGDGAEGLTVDAKGYHIVVRVEYPEDGDEVGESHLKIRMPRTAELNASTVTADLDVDEMRGSVEAQVVSGDIEVGGAPSECDIELVSGNVDIDAVCPDLSIEVVDGDVNIRGAMEELRIESVSGDVLIEPSRVKRLQVESVAGDVRFEGDLGEDASCRVTVHSGEVVLLLPGDVDAHFAVRTFSGDIVNAFGEPAEKTNELVPGKALTFRAGTGAARVRIETFSGNVRLEMVE